MEEVNTAIGNIKAVEAGNNFGLKSTESPFSLPFYFTDFYDEKACKSFIKKTEKLIRNSPEYKTYIELLRSNVSALNCDNLLSNISAADASIEFHHYPFSLYDIVQSVTSKHILKQEKFSSFSIAKEVMELHYKHNIGLVPLVKTTHELAHSGNLFISKK